MVEETIENFKIQMYAIVLYRAAKAYADLNQVSIGDAIAYLDNYLFNLMENQ